MSDPLQAAPTRSGLAAVSLGSQTQGRHNNIQLLRLLAACAVVVFHCYALTDRWTDEPLWRLAPELNFGALGVKTFFVISGFLVTQSWLARADLASFSVARALRIYPALMAATIFTIALAAVSTALPMPAFLAHRDTFDFAWQTATGWAAPVALPGAYARNPFPNAVNGSLWTLPIEIRLYVALAIAGIAGVLARRSRWTVVVAALLVLGAIVPDAITLPLKGGPGNRPVLELALMFALGSLAYVWRDAIPLSLTAMLVALALVAWNPGGAGRGVLFEPLLAYAVLVVAYHPLLRWDAFNRLGDYSYGVYVYSFPIQQTLVEHLRGIEPRALLALALPLAIAAGALSWHALERPALRLKSRFRSSTALAS
jgi:peptidoglycan/LPS O-acetylase OafA/YrhL